MSVILRVPCDEQMHADVLAAAEQDDRPMASWIRQAIKEKLNRDTVLVDQGWGARRRVNQPDD